MYIGPDQLSEFDEVILATGVLPRQVDIPGIEHDKSDQLFRSSQSAANAGAKVAVIGAGGIGFDVCEYLAHQNTAEVCTAATQADIDHYCHEWGIDLTVQDGGGLTARQHQQSSRELYLLQRRDEKAGAGLGKTTGWIHRTSLKHLGVKSLTGVQYQRIDDNGLHIIHDDQEQCLAVDQIVICAGQESLRELYQPLHDCGLTVHVIGGADVAAELDAKRAIDQDTPGS